MSKLIKIATVVIACAGLSGCYGMRPTSGGGKLTRLPEQGVRTLKPDDVALPAGYRIEAVASGLTFPTGVAFDERGTAFVVESGYAYGEVWTEPRLLRVDKDGVTVVARGGKNGPWTGVTRLGGAFYIAEGGELEGGRILRVGADGELKPVISGLPTRGDHHTNGPAAGPDGFLYFGTGTMTNSAVVGEDNFKFGWLKRFPKLHDIPCADVTLTGENYVSPDVLKGEGVVATGAFMPFGTFSAPGEVIKGDLFCNGAVYRTPPAGGNLQLVAWGFRNPFGLAFSPQGELYVTDNAYDKRGSRPVFGAGDALWRVQEGTWYGWPDYSAGLPVDSGDQFKTPLQSRPRLLLARHPNAPPKPAAVLPVHASADGLDFSRSEHFGYPGEAFIALFGDQSPGTGKVMGPVGFKVVRVDVKDGVQRDFAVNRGRMSAPASALGTGGLERPVAVRFDPSGESLYVVDFGVLKETPKGSVPVPNTGVLWRISRDAAP